MLPGLIPVITPKQPTIVFLHTTANATTTATISMGTATPTTPGLLVVAYVSTGSASRSVSDISIGGSTGTIHVAVGGSQRPRALASRLVSSGANAISVVTNSTTTTANNLVGAWLITGYRSTTPISTGNGTANATSVSAAFAGLLAGAVGCFGTMCGSTVTITWSGGPTTVGETTIAAVRGSFASWNVSSAQTATVQTSGSASAQRSIIGAAWR